MHSSSLSLAGTPHPSCPLACSLHLWRVLHHIMHFQDTCTKDAHGQYVMSLPRHTPPPKLGKSRETALQRYLSNERSLCKVGQWETFHQGVQKYLDLGHAELVPARELTLPAASTFYLPMHGVVKDSSTTMKLRIVFDDSARSSTRVLLNDALLSGPSLYPLLSTIIRRFRTFPVAISGDVSKMFREVSKMFREVGLHEFNRDLHIFLNRSDSGL